MTTTNHAPNLRETLTTGQTVNADIPMDIEESHSFPLFGSELHDEKKNHKLGLAGLVTNLGCDTSAKYDLEKTILNFSAGQKHCSITKLLQYGGPKCDNGSYVLRVAAKRQYADFVKLLLKVGADVNAKSKHGYSALHLAIVQERYLHLQSQDSSRDLNAIENIARILLERGADVNSMTNNGFSPLHYAVNFGYSDVVSLLLKYGADVNVVIEKYVKHAETGECFCVLDHICSLMASRSQRHRSTDGPWKDPPSTILHVAVMKTYSDIVRMLLENGAEVDAVQYDGKTPLLVAFEENGENCEKVVEILLEHGASVNFKCVDGKAALHYAALKGNLGAVELLMKNGAVVDSLDRHKNTPLAFAVEYGFEEVVKSLLEHEADVDSKNARGMTPLHIACEKAKSGTVGLLLKAGASVNSICRRGLLPYHYALNSKRQLLVSILADYRNRDSFNETRLTEFAIILQLLQKHINIVNQLNLPLHKYNKNISKMASSIEITKDEIARFRSKTVYKNFTVEHFLKSNNDPVYVMNENALQGLVKVMSDLDEKESDLINVLKYVVRTAKIRFDLINNAQDCLLCLITNSGNPLPMLPEEVARSVVLLLNNEELQSFIGKIFKLKQSTNNCRKRKLEVS